MLVLGLRYEKKQNKTVIMGITFFLLALGMLMVFATINKLSKPDDGFTNRELQTAVKERYYAWHKGEHRKIDSHKYRKMNEKEIEGMLPIAKELIPDISKTELWELFNISQNMPVFAGNTISHQSARSLIDKRLAMKYEGEYVLTEAGKVIVKKIYDRSSIIDLSEVEIKGH